MSPAVATKLVARAETIHLLVSERGEPIWAVIKLVSLASSVFVSFL